MTGDYGSAGHVFISYRQEDSAKADRLEATLEAAGLRVWRDKGRLWPGDDWSDRIRDAITNDALVFLACFSSTSLARDQSWQDDELALAVEQRQQRPQSEAWLIPVRFDDCEIPDIDLGGGKTLRSIQRADFFGDEAVQAAGLVRAINRILTRAPESPAGSSPTSSAVTSGTDEIPPTAGSAAGGLSWRSRSVRVALTIAGAVAVAAIVLTVHSFGSPSHGHASSITGSAHPHPFLAAKLTDPGDCGPSALAFSPDGKTLAVGATNAQNNKGFTYEWSLTTHVITATLHDPHSTGAFDVAYNPSGTILAIGDHNGSTYLWDAARGVIIATLHEPGGRSVDAVAFSPGGTTLATGDASSNTYLWNLASHTITAILPSPSIMGVDSLAFMPGAPALAVGGVDGSIHLWNLTNHRVTAVLDDPDNANPSHGGAHDLAFFPDGRMLADGDGNGHAYLWNVSRYAISAALADPHSLGANAVAVNPAGTMLATGDFNDHAYLWDVATGRLLAALPSQYPVYDVALSPAGTTLATVDGQRTDLWEGL